MKQECLSYWQVVWKRFKQHRLGMLGLSLAALFCLVGIYAPFFASSKPFFVSYEGEWFFPFFRYLFFRGFYTKPLDIFYNLLMFTFPLFLLSHFLWKNQPNKKKISGIVLCFFQFFLFFVLMVWPIKDPASDPILNSKKQQDFQKEAKEGRFVANFENELNYMTKYGKLNQLLDYQFYQEQDKRLKVYQQPYENLLNKKDKPISPIPSLWYFQALRQENKQQENKRLIQELAQSLNQSALRLKSLAKSGNITSLQEEEKLSKETLKKYLRVQSDFKYLEDKSHWLELELKKLQKTIVPFFIPYHAEDDIGGNAELNQVVGWQEVTRVNRKSLLAALLFGIRTSLSVGLLAVGLALSIGIPLGAISGYYGGKIDLILCRLIEIWEGMPIFFMLLMTVAFLQTKSIFLIVAVIGFFGWTNFSALIRGEFLRQKQLPYVEACHALGFHDFHIIFSELLPNAIPPLLTLIPFSIMAAMTSEAGLSFLGLGEEGASSWGILMDEGRLSFPAESYLLWPPAILLTTLLISIALIGDALRDSLDPKTYR